MFYIAFSLTLAAAVLMLLFISKKEGQSILDRVIKIATVLFISLSLIELFLPDLFMCTHEADTLKTMTGTKLHAILRWLNLVSFTVLPIAVFQKNKYFEKIASFVCFPVAIVNVAAFDRYIEYFTANSYSGLQTVRVLPQTLKDALINEHFRTVFFGLTCLFQLVALALLTYRNREKIKIAKNEIVNLILILIGLTYISLPIYVPQYLFGHVDLMMIRFTPVHLAWIAAIPIILVSLYFMFRNKSYEARYLLVLSLAWALVMQFSQMYTASSELNIMKLPLQLCNLGSYLGLIMLLKKSNSIFRFALIVNVVGAVIAIIVLDIGKDISHLSRLWVVHFIVEHTKVFIIPILCLVLRIFKPLDMKSIKSFTFGFTAYYLFVFVLGTISNGFYRMFEGNFIQNFFYANHLFMFDKDIARGLVGFTDPLFDACVLKFGSFEIYPVVQGLVYVAYMVLCLGVYLLMYALSGKQRKSYALQNSQMSCETQQT